MFANRLIALGVEVFDRLGELGVVESAVVILVVSSDHHGDDRFWIMARLAGLRYIGERSSGGDEGYDCGDCDMLGVHFTYSPVVNCFVFQGTEEVFFVLYVPIKPQENYRTLAPALRFCNVAVFWPENGRKGRLFHSCLYIAARSRACPVPRLTLLIVG